MNLSTQQSLLIVDDSPTNIKIAASILSPLDCRISFATSGAEAFNLLDMMSIDLILLDIMMPEMDGYEVCNRLKQNPKTSEIPVMFLTAKADIDSILNGFEAGAVDYITKPFNAKELFARVKTQLTLRRQTQELRQLNANKNRFFSIVAHDLKSPLVSLINLMNIVNQSIDDNDLATIKELFANIMTSTQNIYRLMENLLEWARFQQNLIQYYPQLLDLKKIIDINLDLFQPVAQQKQIEFVYQPSPGLTVYADEHMLHTIIRNLLSNALKFTPVNGRVKISARPSADNFLEITVEDTGIGIDQPSLEKLFRIERVYTQKGTDGEKGTGLGLILCKEFIEKNGGAIRITGHLKAGCCVTCTIPTGPPSETPDCPCS